MRLQYMKNHLKVRSPRKSYEWVWADLKRFVRKRLCSTEAELIRAIHYLQAQLNPQ